MTKYTAHFTGFTIELTGEQAQQMHYGTQADLLRGPLEIRRPLPAVTGKFVAELRSRGLFSSEVAASSVAQWRAILVLAAEEIVENNPELKLPT